MQDASKDDLEQTKDQEVLRSAQVCRDDCTLDEGACPESSEKDSRGVKPSLPRCGHMVGPGIVHFPVMSQDELAAISVPASASADQLRMALAEHGVCLVEGILDQQQCLDFENLWRDDLLSVLQGGKGNSDIQACLKGLREDGIVAWPHAWSGGLGKKGSVSQRGLPHGAFAWNARLHAGVRQVFSEIYGTHAEHLSVGADCTFWSGADSRAANSNVEWLHCDQNHRTGLTWPCVQGVLYVWPSEGESASTTVVWPGSHKEVYTRIMNDKTAYKRRQSVKLQQLSDFQLREDLTSQAVACSRRVPCPAGSLLLWDSRTIHQGWNGGPRLAQPVCWEPRQRREQDRDALKRKIYMCAAGIPSSHSSSEARVHGMAPRSRPCEMMQSGEVPAMRSQIVPYCVADRQAWEKAQSVLWGNCGDVRRNASCTSESVLGSLLKPEVLAAL